MFFPTKIQNRKSASKLVIYKSIERAKMIAEETEETIVYVTIEALLPFSMGKVMIKRLITTAEDAEKINETE